MTTYLIQSFVYLLYVSTYHSLHYTALGPFKYYVIFAGMLQAGGQIRERRRAVGARRINTCPPDF